MGEHHKWSEEKTVLEDLQEQADASYRDFQCRLIPTVAPETVLGVRVPEVRKLAAQLHNTEQAAAFMQQLPHRYYDENNLHACLIEKITPYEACVQALDQFLPFVDNWATCDMMHPRVFHTHPKELPAQAHQWMKSDHPYTVRFGIGVLLSEYLDDFFDPVMPEWVAAVRSQEYYVNMMAAWYFATALCKQPETIWPYLKDQKLDEWVRQKAIQKAIESRRISKEEKEVLRALRREKEK